MRHGDTLAKLSRGPTARMRMLRQLCSFLFIHEHIVTTLARAKALIPYADKTIALAKRTDSVSSRLSVFDRVSVPNAGTKALTELASRYKDRQGGFTRLYRLGIREKDKAPIAVIELVDSPFPVMQGMSLIPGLFQKLESK